MRNVKVGDAVVCVDDAGTAPNYNLVDPNYPAQELFEGREYVVRWIGPAWLPYEGDYLGVRLAGIVRPYCPVAMVDDPAFKADRFRPVVSGKRAKEKEEVV